MKREFLEELGLEKDVVEKIIIEHGKTIQMVQAEKPEDYDELKIKSKEFEEKVKELETELASSTLNFEEQNNTLLDEINTFKEKDLKLKVARDHNIPFDLAYRLKGATEDELIADAKTLSSFVSSKEILPLKEATDTTVDPYSKMVDDLEK